MKRRSRQEIKIIFIGQAPPATPAKVPFARTRLFVWLKSVGLSQDFVCKHSIFEALVKDFPGASNRGHLKPSQDMISLHRPHLIALVNSAPDAVIVPVGIMAIKEIIGEACSSLADVIGHRFERPVFDSVDDRIVIPLPHPSGGSAWPHQGNNAVLLSQSLKCIEVEINSAAY